MNTTPLDEGQTVERLVRVETKLDVLIADINPRHGDLEKRVRAAEIALSEIKVRASLIATLLGSSAGVVSAVLVHFLGS